MNKIVLMVGRKNIAILNPVENTTAYLHKEGQLLKKNCNNKFEIHNDYVLAGDGSKRRDKFTYWKTTKRGKVYKQNKSNYNSLIGYLPISLEQMDIPIFYPLKKGIVNDNFNY